MIPKLSSGLIFIALFSFYSKMNAQTIDNTSWEWVKSLNATNTYNIYGNSIAIDPNGTGDIYVAGGFEGEVDFDPGPGTTILTTGSQAIGIFISKFDGSGNFLWVKSMIGSTGGGSGHVRTINTSTNGDVYLTGLFEGTVDFDPGDSIFKLSSKGADDIFISKLNSDGDFVWTKSLGGPGADTGNSIVIDTSGSGDIYTIGTFSGTVDFDPGNSMFNLSSVGPHAVFISKLDSEGNFVWAQAMVGTGTSDGYSISVDPSGKGDIYITGPFTGTVDFDPGPDSFNLPSVGNADIFISKLDSSGVFKWAISIGGTGSDVSRSIAFDPVGSGYVYTTGWFTGTVDFDPGPDDLKLVSKAGNRDVFVSRFSSNGKFLWAKGLGGIPDDEGISLAIDPLGTGNVYILGNFSGTPDFDPGPSLFEAHSAGGYDIFISSLDSSGNFAGAKIISGTGNDYITDISFDTRDHNMIISGFFKSPSLSFDSIKVTNVNTSGADLFIAKLKSTSFTHGQIFVKQNATGNNDGTSWQNAFTKFQDALDHADKGDQLWIAAGTYIPEGPSPDSSHFLSKKAVSIYGGFEGTESDLSQRNWQTFRTIINGDILGDDQDSTNRLDNAHHVLIINNGDGETTLDGLIFSGGRGALYILNTDVKIRNCTFWDNDGEYGSGLFARNSDSISNTLVIKNSTFEQNRGIGGAAIFLGVFNNARRLHYEIDSCTFKNNISYSAGTIYSTSDSISQHTSIIKNSEFLNNIGNYGGGAIFSVSENLIIENCNFEENYARLYPGCICPSGGIITFINPSSAHIAIRKTIFNNNDVYEFEDGVVNIFGGYAELDNVLFHDNYGYSSILSYGNTRLSNITMVDNQGGLIGYGNSTEIQNSIFDNEEVNLRYWEGADIISKGGNISSDSSMAQFLMGYNGHADLHQTDPLLDADFIPLSNSPCIDAGNSEGVVSLYDLAGNPRIQGHGIDAGAYESPFMVAVKDAVWDSQVLSVYPNPVLDVLNFELESDWIGKIILRVYNNQGQPVYNSEMNKSDRIQTFSENLNLLPPGEYVVLATAGKTTYATKVIFLK